MGIVKFLCINSFDSEPLSSSTPESLQNMLLLISVKISVFIGICFEYSSNLKQLSNLFQFLSHKS